MDLHSGLLGGSLRLCLDTVLVRESCCLAVVFISLTGSRICVEEVDKLGLLVEVKNNDEFRIASAICAESNKGILPRGHQEKCGFLRNLSNYILAEHF